MISREREARLERIDLYNPEPHRSVTVNYHPKGRCEAHHTHDFYEINYVLAGSITEVVSGRPIPMRAGDAILMHPGTFHLIRDDADAKVLNILVRPQWLTAALASVREGALFPFAQTAGSEEYIEYIVFSGGAAPVLEVDRLIGEATSHLPYARMAAEGALLTLLAALARRPGITVAEGHSTGYRRFGEILSYLYENARDLRVSLLAARFGYSAAHLSRLFVRYTGEPPAVHLQRARLHRAAALLLESDAPVSRLAEEAGFPAAPYFHRLFKRVYGQTPEEYRKNQR